MIRTLHIKCVSGAYLEEPFERTIEASEDITLGELHDEIQLLSGFDNDHLFTFFVARGPRGKRSALIETDDYEERHERFYELPLNEIFPLAASMKLFYWFDFGDDWIFQIGIRGKSKSEEKGAKYPKGMTKMRCISITARSHGAAKSAALSGLARPQPIERGR